MLNWLEIPANYKIITGAATEKKKYSGSEKLTKQHAYQGLADYINKSCQIKEKSQQWDSKDAKSRFEAQFRKYKETRQKFSETGGEKFCLTFSELCKGKTIESKLEEMFNKIDVLASHVVTLFFFLLSFFSVKFVKLFVTLLDFQKIFVTTDEQLCDVH